MSTPHLFLEKMMFGVVILGGGFTCITLDQMMIGIKMSLLSNIMQHVKQLVDSFYKTLVPLVVCKASNWQVVEQETNRHHKADSIIPTISVGIIFLILVKTSCKIQEKGA